MRRWVGCLVLALLVPMQALAQTAGPENLRMVRGALAIGDQVLFVSDRTTDAPCSRPCSATPFLAARDAIEGGGWTLAPAEGGRRWLYNGARLFLWPQVGANSGVHYFTYPDMMANYYGLRPAQIEDPLREGLAYVVNDPRIAARPTIERRTLLNYNLAEDGVGIVEITTCIDQEGRSGPLILTGSSGSTRLDATALDFARVVPFVPARIDTGETVAVCGATLRVAWPDAPGTDPWRAQVAVVTPTPTP